MIRTVVSVEKPGDVDVTISVTMPLSDWLLIKRDLSPGSVPSSALRAVVSNAVDRIEAQLSVLDSDRSRP